MSASPVFVYDGDCGVCTRFATWLARRAPAAAEVVPSHLADLAAHGLTEADVVSASYWLEPGGPALRGHLGVARALRAVGGGPAVAGAVIAAPGVRSLAAVAYRAVARHRHRLPGGTDACRIPSPSSRPTERT